MKSCINDDYQLPASVSLICYLKSGMTADHQKIFDDLRNHSGSTALHAENCGMDLKTYNRKASETGQHCIRKLLAAAEIGLKHLNDTK